MDWEQLTIIAQIATGAATLAVAAFLASQLRQQHRDAEREILYTSNQQYIEINGAMLDSEFVNVWRRGTEDYDSLVDPDEEMQFRTWNRLSSIFQATNFSAGHDALDRGIDSRIYEQAIGAWGMWPGIATYYERHGRSHTYDPDLKTTLDAAFLASQGREVETTWVLGVNNGDSLDLP